MHTSAMRRAMKKESEASPESSARFSPRRGSLITLHTELCSTSNLAVVVSNDVQNDVSDFLLVVPLERRASRLRAPFAVDLGRKDGFRELHTVRCDWLTRVYRSQVRSIERAILPRYVIADVETGLRAALGLNSDEL